MDREKKLILIANCILNQNSVVKPLARAKGAYNDIVKEIIDKDIGIIQLPCAEFRYLGENRPSMTKKEYDTFEFRDLCKNLAQEMITQIKEYLKHGYKIVGLIGINQSPTCDISGDRGIFMEELFYFLNKEDIEIPTIEIPTYYRENEKNKDFLKDFKLFLTSSIY
ncbi:MAG: hypothetical protein FH753_12105 [Firmicutes bacterium]|nr:hypothetical protein [Bacillota bacterium]